MSIFGIFRGHVPAPVPDKLIELPPEPRAVTAKELRNIVDLSFREAYRKAGEYFVTELSPRLLEKAKAGDISMYVTTHDFIALDALREVLLQKGFNVTNIYGGNQVTVSWDKP